MDLLCLLVVSLVVAGGHSERRPGKKAGVCRTQAGQVYTVGQSYTEDCVTYTCTKLGRKMMTLVPSVIGKCCEVKSRGLYKAGEIIEMSSSGPGNCTRKTVRCELTPHDRPQVTLNIETSANCCLYRGQPAQLGARFPVPEKCAWLECRLDIFSQTGVYILTDFQISQTPVLAWNSPPSTTAVIAVWPQPQLNNSSFLMVKGDESDPPFSYKQIFQ